jgi:hypothetical protein
MGYARKREITRASEWNEQFTLIQIYCHALASPNYGLVHREQEDRRVESVYNLLPVHLTKLANARLRRK